MSCSLHPPEVEWTDIISCDWLLQSAVCSEFRLQCSVSTKLRLLIAPAVTNPLIKDGFHNGSKRIILLPSTIFWCSLSSLSFPCPVNTAIHMLLAVLPQLTWHQPFLPCGLCDPYAASRTGVLLCPLLHVPSTPYKDAYRIGLNVLHWLFMDSWG